MPTFLTEMDGLEESGSIMLLATNRADILDPAVVRDGRIDRKVRIGRPDQARATEIFKLHLKNVPLHKDFINGPSMEGASKIASEELFSAKLCLYSIQKNDDSAVNFTLGNLCSGAMIAGIVDQATSLAMQRDITNGDPQGITEDDIRKAVERTFVQNANLNHKDELADFVHDFRDDVVGINKLRQATA